MAFIEQRQWTLYLLYPSISYSVPDTMISITIGSVWRGIKICQSLKNLHLGLDIIGRIVFLFRFIGVFTLGNLVMFLNRLLVKKDRLPRVVVGVVWVLPAVIGLAVVLAGGSSYAICGFSDSLIMTNVLAFCYDYIAILFFVNVIILAVCKFYRIYNYTEEDVARMERHFGGGLG